MIQLHHCKMPIMDASEYRGDVTDETVKSAIEWILSQEEYTHGTIDIIPIERDLDSHHGLQFEEDILINKCPEGYGELAVHSIKATQWHGHNPATWSFGIYCNRPKKQEVTND